MHINFSLDVLIVLVLCVVAVQYDFEVNLFDLYGKHMPLQEERSATHSQVKGDLKKADRPKHCPIKSLFLQLGSVLHFSPLVLQVIYWLPAPPFLVCVLHLHSSRGGNPPVE